MSVRRTLASTPSAGQGDDALAIQVEGEAFQASIPSTGQTDDDGDERAASQMAATAGWRTRRSAEIAK